MKRTYLLTKFVEDVERGVKSIRRRMSKKEVLELLDANFPESFAGIDEFYEFGDGTLRVTYKNGRTLLYKNYYGKYAFPAELV